MQVTPQEGVLFLIGVIIAAVGFIGVVLLVNRVIAPRNPTPEKATPYECGMEQAGQPWNAPRLRFAAIAMLFVLFDAEAVMLFAVASRLRGSPIALVEVGIFVTFLAVGLVYAWRKGALEWRT